MDLYRQFAKKYDLIFLDYSNDPISYNKSLFYNANHLNAKGSEIFTRKLALDIKRSLKRNRIAIPRSKTSHWGIKFPVSSSDRISRIIII